MSKVLTSNIISFFFFTLIQVLFFLNFNIYEWGFAFVYIGFIFFLPLNMPSVLVLFLAFIQGITVDMFYNTIGAHAASLVFLAYLKPTLTKLLIPKMVDDATNLNAVNQLGTQRLLVMLLILTFIHHFFLFALINTGFNFLGINLIKAILSALISVFIIFTIKKIFFKNF